MLEIILEAVWTWRTSNSVPTCLVVCMTTLMGSGVKRCVWREGIRLQLWKLETFASFINVIS